MAYKLLLFYIDAAGEQRKTTITSSTEFTDEKANTFRNSIAALLKVKICGWARIAESAKDTVLPTTGNVDRKVIYLGADANGETYKWEFPDPAGATEKPLGTRTEHLTTAEAAKFTNALNTLLGVSMVATECRIIQRQ